jgi:hypothetical protein
LDNYQTKRRDGRLFDDDFKVATWQDIAAILDKEIISPRGNTAALLDNDFNNVAR